MPNVSLKKLKLLYLLQMLWENTDDQHALTLPRMLEELERLGISAERKSLYDDIETLRQFGVPIETRKGRTFEYFIAERPFTQSDVHLLAESVLQVPFLSSRRAAQLRKKLTLLGSVYQGEQLLQSGGREEPALLEQEADETAAQEPVPVEESPSTEELVRAAMERDVQVVLQLSPWRLHADGKLVRSRKTVVVSPWRILRRAAILSLYAYGSEEKRFLSLPLEEIHGVELLSNPREGEKKLPGWERLTLEFPVGRLEEVCRFFDGAMETEPFGKGKIRAVVQTQLDAEFFAWLFSQGPELRLTAPKKAAEQFRERAKSLAKAYKP